MSMSPAQPGPAMTPPDPLAFWFDFASTYSYLSAGRIERAAAAAGVPIAWKPFVLGPIFAGQGWKDSPFNIYPLKGRYMWREMERLCARYDLPFQKPSRFPQGSVLAARVACLGARERWCPDFVRAVFHANFAEDRDISDVGVITTILDAIGQPGSELVQQAQSPEHKGDLRRQTEEATALGLFGAPSFTLGSELFWGNDRLEDALAWYLEQAGDPRRTHD
jgi:2-hydroxychromene-2-carboxylate isomerase